MLTIELEAETLQISRYCEVITQILYINKNLSLIKLITFAYIVKNDSFSIYSAKDTKEVSRKCLSTLSGQYNNFLNNIPTILKSIHILKTGNRISVENSIVSLIRTVSVLNQIYEKDSFIYKAIKDSKNMSDRQFLKEVISNV